MSDWRSAAVMVLNRLQIPEGSEWRRHADAVDATLAARGMGSSSSEGCNGQSSSARHWVPDDAAIVRCAAILHDVSSAADLCRHGLPGERALPQQSRSARTAAAELSQTIPWMDHHRAIERVAGLIEALTLTRGSFPTPSEPGGVVSVRDWFGLSAPDDGPLARLREADALEHLSPPSVAWAIELGRSSRLAIAPGVGSIGIVPMWGDSVIGNLRLLAKCAWRDVSSSPGRIQLAQLLSETESQVRALCERASAYYAPELCDFNAAIAVRGAAPPQRYAESRVQLLSASRWIDFRTSVEHVKLFSDPNVPVYPGAQVRLARPALNLLRPTAFYVLRANIERARDMHTLWLALYGLTPLDIPTTVLCSIDSSEPIHVSPPFIEYDFADGGDVHEPTLSIVDGLHRLAVARKLGFHGTTCVIIDGASVPLPVEPLTWDQVTEVDVTPEHENKRIYRYSTSSELREAGVPLTVAITDKNAPHLLYRNYAAFGSTGVRQSGTASA
jgi:hypothetical protein